MKNLPRMVFLFIYCLIVCVGLFARQANAVLIHHWNVEGDTAGTLTDSVGGIDLTYIDPDEGSLSAFAAAPGAGSSQGFTTVTGGDATSPNPDDLFMASSFSMALWTQRLEATGSAQPMLLGVIEDQDGFNHNYLIRSNPVGDILLFFTRDDSGTTISLTSSAGLDDFGWHHVAATFDWSGTAGTAATAKIFVDGVETGTVTEAVWNGWDAAVQTQGGIGQEGFTPVANYDDLRIYDNVLSSQEIADLAVTSAVNELGLEANTTTGEVTLVNGTGAPIDIDYYEIRSATGDLLVGLDADFETDGDVDGDDLLIWQKGFGTTSGATRADGDADADRDVDGDDFLVWQTGFGSVAAASGWESLQDQDLPDFPASDGTGNGWEEGVNVDETVLLETFLLGSSAVSVDAAISLGNAFSVGGTEVLAFEYHRAGAGPNDFVTGTVDFVTPGSSQAASVPEPATFGMTCVILISTCGAARARRWARNAC